MKQKCRKCGKKYDNIVSKFCSLDCAYSYSELDLEDYLLLRAA